MDVEKDKVLKALTHLSIEMNINFLYDERRMFTMIRAFEYAGLDSFFIEPKSTVEIICNEIFYTRATGYFNRKMKELFKGTTRKELYDIWNFEQNTVHHLKMQLPPYKLFKKQNNESL